MVLEECMTWKDIKCEARHSGQPLINSDNTLLPVVLCSTVNNQRALWVSRFISRPRRHSGKRICLPMPETQETWIRSLNREDPLEEEQPAPVFLPRKFPWIREPDGLDTVHGVSKSQTRLNSPLGNSRQLLWDYKIRRSEPLRQKHQQELTLVYPLSLSNMT